VGGGARLGGVGDHGQAGVGRQLQGLIGQLQVAGDRVMQPLAAAAVQPDVVGGPAGPEGLAGGGQLPDQVGQPPVVRVAAGLATQDGHGVISGLVPVNVEVACSGVQEQEPGQVDRQLLAGQDRRVQGVPEAVGAEDVQAAGAHIGRHTGHGVQEPLDAGPDPLGAAGPPRPGRGGGGAGQVEQMRPLGLVQLQGAGEGMQDAVRDPTQVAPLHLGVAVDVHPSQ
jgi:hypothetical protein